MQVGQPVAPLAMADQGDDFAALGHAAAEVVERFREIIEAKRIQFLVIEELGDEQAEFGVSRGHGVW